MSGKRGRPTNASKRTPIPDNEFNIAGDNLFGNNRSATDSDAGPAIFTISESTAGSTEPVGSATDTGDTGTFATGGDAAPKRGRPPGKAKTQVDLAGIEQFLTGIHGMLSGITQIPEIAMTNDAAKEIAKNYVALCQYYPSLAIPPKQAAIANFAACVGMTYGGMFFAYKLRRSMEAPKPKQAPRQGPIPQQTPPQSMTQQQTQVNGGNIVQERQDISKEARTANIPGVGTVEFPADSPLISGKNFN